jgi:polyketide cyclase/dehydrase/lipid transport protein
MASIRKEIVVDVGAEAAWDALRRVGQPHTLFAPVLTSSNLEGDVRTVRFSNGKVISERILDVDEEHRRVAYAVVEPQGMTYHHASMEIGLAGPGRCTFLWITDFLPAEAAAGLQPLVDQGAEALKRNLEQVGTVPRASAAGPT